MANHKKNGHVDQFVRCFDIITRLQAGQTMSAKTIAELYGLTTRNGYRIMNYIERSLPVYAAHETPLELKWMEK